MTFDIYWGSGYSSGPYAQTGVSVASNYNFEKFFLLIRGIGKASMTVNILGLYTIVLTPTAELFNIHPIEAAIMFYRPENGSLLSHFDINFRLNTFVNFLRFFLQVQEKGAVTYKSISNYLANPNVYVPYP